MDETTTIAAPLSPAAQMRDAFWRLKQSRVRVSPAHTCRASSIGHDCERYLYYERAAGEMKVPHPPKLQAIFDLGKELERFVIREIEAMGLDVMQRERDYLDRERELSAHADAKVSMRTWVRGLPLEIKGLNPYTADHVTTLQDIRECRQKWVRKYYDQLQTYIHFDDAPAGIFALLNKTSGGIEFIDCPRDPERIGYLLAKAERIRDAVKASQPPGRTESDDCERCGFAHICLPNRSFGPGVQVLDAAEAMMLIERRMVVAPLAKELEEIDSSLKRMLPEAQETIVGDFLVKAKKIEPKGKKPYWQRQYLKNLGSTGT